jgi:hypothetical protein
MNEAEAKLYGAIKSELVSMDTLFTEFKLGKEIYGIKMNLTDQNYLASVYKTKSYGYLYSG